MVLTSNISRYSILILHLNILQTKCLWINSILQFQVFFNSEFDRFTKGNHDLTLVLVFTSLYLLSILDGWLFVY